MKKILLAATFILTSLFVFGQKKEKGMDELWGENSEKANYTNKDYQWYKEAKFAMFIHWGLYSELAGEYEGKRYYGINEWIMRRAAIKTEDYRKLADTFNPVNFDAEEVAQLAVDAGMKYLVITAKHHDGFALFDSKVSDYNITNTPYKKDIVKQLAKACKKKGIRFGFYYSQMQDWNEKDGFGNTWEFNADEANVQKYMEEKALPQVKELVTNYGDIGCIFFDTPGPIKHEQVLELKALVDKYQPDCLINSRIGKGLGDFKTLGDNEIPSEPVEGLWETCDTHNNTWAYSKLDFNWKTPKEVAHRLIDVISKGGNYLFNIGPKGDGSVPEVSAMILRETGKWLKKYEEAIYGTDAMYLGGQTQFAATQKGNKMYLFIKEWPKDNKIYLPKFKSGVKKAYFMDDNLAVTTTNLESATLVNFLLRMPDPVASVIVVEFDGKPELNADKVFNTGLTTKLLPHEAKLTACTSEKIRWMEIFGDWHAVPSIMKWEGKGSKAEWEVNVPKEGMYTVTLNYACTEAADMQEGILTINDTEYLFVPTYSGDKKQIENKFEKRSIRVFKDRKIGVVNFDKKGKQTISITLNSDNASNWIDLASVSFEPIIPVEDNQISN
ncbi:alpha-L-fucosidase [Flammeovirga agarivorans]|uniref:alpha-L-fucosidase n=1 Tax=Flammeovirga agarivorans TaxID=2726742 RepID=A0A7X8SND5_9BACT|nr:alpha-L-fucosidase [Flammeovirga agarivorans]NLR93307.1 alpha-L-fucosidase [Flammeovirga agarivorans]